MRTFPFLPKVFGNVQKAKLSGPQIATTRQTVAVLERTSVYDSIINSRTQIISSY